MIAEQVYVDPSALVSLYIHGGFSRKFSDWRFKIRGSLPVTHHGRTEVINAICRLSYTEQIDDRARIDALDNFADDLAQGRLIQADLLWRSALEIAAELSKEFTPKLGTRSLDVLHVACALELKLRKFLTFDERQRKLAAAAGLKTIRL